MAKPLTHSVTPAGGYWTTKNYDEVVNFIVNYLQKTSIKSVIYTLAIFLKDAKKLKFTPKVTLMPYYT